MFPYLQCNRLDQHTVLPIQISYSLCEATDTHDEADYTTCDQSYERYLNSVEKPTFSIKTNENVYRIDGSVKECNSKVKYFFGKDYCWRKLTKWTTTHSAL